MTDEELGEALQLLSVCSDDKTLRGVVSLTGALLALRCGAGPTADYFRECADVIESSEARIH